MCSRARRNVDAIDPTWSPPSRAKANRRAPTRTRSKTNAPTRRGRTSASCASFSCRTICHTNSRSRCSRSSASRRPRSSSSLPTRTRARHHASGANTEGISGRAGLSRRLGYGRLPHTNQPPLSESRRTARLRRSACAGAAVAALTASPLSRGSGPSTGARGLCTSPAHACVCTPHGMHAQAHTHARAQTHRFAGVHAQPRAHTLKHRFARSMSARKRVCARSSARARARMRAVCCTSILITLIHEIGEKKRR